VKKKLVALSIYSPSPRRDKERDARLEFDPAWLPQVECACVNVPVRKTSIDECHQKPRHLGAFVEARLGYQQNLGENGILGVKSSSL